MAMQSTDGQREKEAEQVTRFATDAVLIVTQWAGSLGVVEVVLNSRGIRTLVAEGAAQADSIIRRVHPRLVVLDVDLAAMDAQRLEDTVSEVHALPGCAAVLLGVADLATGGRLAADTGADAYMRKPLDSTALADHAREIFAAARSRQQHWEGQPVVAAGA